MRKTPKLYDKVKAILKDKILLGEYKPGDRLPCSKALAEEYSVSLITIRRVFSELQNDGLIQLRQGKNAQVISSYGNRGKPRILRQNINHMRNIFIIRAPSVHNSINKQAGPWTYNIFSGIQSELLMAGIPFTFLPLENPSEILEIIKSNAEFCSGVIIFTSHIHKMIDRLIAEIKKPYCLISNRREFNCITPDYYDGARMVAEYFLDKHISHFVITYDSMTGVSVQKLRGFQETLLDNGVSPESIHPLKVENNNEESGRKAIMHFISTNKQEYPIGIFTLGDYLAKGICAGCIEKGIKIPDECMVVGGTGLSDTTDFNPPLSVLADPMFETGAKAAKMISKMIKTSSLKEPSLILPMKLVHRKTTIS